MLILLGLLMDYLDCFLRDFFLNIFIVIFCISLNNCIKIVAKFSDQILDFFDV